MKKQNLQKMAKAIILGLVLGTAATVAQSVWAETPIKEGTGDNSVILNDIDNNIASGRWSTAFGWETTASGEYSMAFCYNTIASGMDSMAFGEQTKASSNLATAFGSQTIADGHGATAFGYKTVAGSNYALAFGYETEANGWYSAAFGKNTIASGEESTAFGKSTTASGEESTAFGKNTTASGAASTAFGDGTEASGKESTAFGKNTIASGEASTAFGSGTEANGRSSTAFGDETIASNWDATAFGRNTIAGGSQSTAFGERSRAGGVMMVDDNNKSTLLQVNDVIYDPEKFGGTWITITAADIAIDGQYYDSGTGLAKTYEAAGITMIGTSSGGAHTTAFGYGTTAGGANATAFGYGTMASGDYSTAFGSRTVASGRESMAFGDQTVASGANATAFGSWTVASGKYSTAFGGGSKATGNYSTAFGDDSQASGDGATAFGYHSKASGYASMAFGNYSEAKGAFSMAVGDHSKAGGNNSLAALGGVTGKWDGDSYKSGTGINAIAIGQGAVASASNSVAIGYYAVADNAPKQIGDTSNYETQFAVGGGNDGNGHTYYARITGVSDGVEAHDAVTVGQVNSMVETQVAAVAATGSTLSTEQLAAINSGITSVKVGNYDEHIGDTTVHITAAERIAWNAKQDALNADSEVSIKTLTTSGNVTAGSIQVGDVKIDNTGINAGNTKITNVADGEFDTDVVNYGQVKSAYVDASYANNVLTLTQIDGGTKTLTIASAGSSDVAASVVAGDVKIDNTGINAGNTKITNVADGEAYNDAATVGQVLGYASDLQSEINTLNGKISRMGTRINKVGAGAAALAAMHPVYDEDSKLTFSAGLGAYRNEKAAAVGMFFRFSPRVMMNAGATVGNDNNMYNVGLNFALDKHVRGGLPSKAVMAKQLTAQSAEIADLKAQIAQLIAMIEELKNK